MDQNRTLVQSVETQRVLGTLIATTLYSIHTFEGKSYTLIEAERDAPNNPSIQVTQNGRDPIN